MHRGNVCVTRAKALAILREIVAEGGRPSMVNLVNVQEDSYELHIKPKVLGIASLKRIAEKHNLKLKEEDDSFTIS